jgi:hypothetical protein
LKFQNTANITIAHKTSTIKGLEMLKENKQKIIGWTRLKRTIVDGSVDGDVLVGLLQKVQCNNPNIVFDDTVKIGKNGLGNEVEFAGFKVTIELNRRETALMSNMAKGRGNLFPFDATIKFIVPDKEKEGRCNKNEPCKMVIETRGNYLEEITSRTELSVATNMESYAKYQVMFGALRYMAASNVYQMDPSANYRPQLPNIEKLDPSKTVAYAKLTKRTYIANDGRIVKYIKDNIISTNNGRGVLKGMSDHMRLKDDFKEGLNEPHRLITSITRGRDQITPRKTETKPKSNKEPANDEDRPIIKRG